MWAPLTQRTLLSLALGLLLLSPDAAGSCSTEYKELLSQLQQQATLLQKHSTKLLLDPYMRLQNLNTPYLKSCREQLGPFPSEKDLRALSRPAFLRAVQARLDRVWDGVTSFLPTFPKDLQDTENLKTALRNIRGFQNNVHCMTQLLLDTSAPPEPTQEGPAASPTPASNTFQRKLEVCKLLSVHHRFIHSVGRVFGEWGAHPSRSRRHSGPLDLWKQAWRTRASRKDKKLVPRSHWPR